VIKLIRGHQGGRPALRRSRGGNYRRTYLALGIRYSEGEDTDNGSEVGQDDDNEDDNEDALPQQHPFIHPNHIYQPPPIDQCCTTFLHILFLILQLFLALNIR
jgi:hypothetical protein